MSWPRPWAKGFQAIRSGDWKLFLQGRDAKLKGGGSAPALFHLATDIEELHDVSAEHPEKVREMTALAEQRLADIRKGIIPLQE